VLAIRNTGPPVPPQEVTSLFEPFRRLGTDRTSNTSGVGLGLSIVRSIVAAHEGTIRARPRPEGGLIIEIEFKDLPVNPAHQLPSLPQGVPRPYGCQPGYLPARPAPPDSARLQLTEPKDSLHYRRDCVRGSNPKVVTECDDHHLRPADHGKRHWREPLPGRSVLFTRAETP
jgi:Histidine kinase-, DNA gyrase B-, and HSP90-like ATPase